MNRELTWISVLFTLKRVSPPVQFGDRLTGCHRGTKKILPLRCSLPCRKKSNAVR
jgi:hypothetical protein